MEIRVEEIFAPRIGMFRGTSIDDYRNPRRRVGRLPTRSRPRPDCYRKPTSRFPPIRSAVVDPQLLTEIAVFRFNFQLDRRGHVRVSFVALF